MYDDAQFQLACIANQRGELLSTDLSKLSESEQNYEQAAQILTRLISNHKSIPHYREEMAVTLCGRAAVRLAMGRIPDAQRDCEAALDHLAWLIGEQTRKGAPENPQYLSLLGQVLDRQSRIHFLRGRSPRVGDPRRGGGKTEPGHPARPRPRGGQGEARTNQWRPGSVGKVNDQDVMMTIPFPVPSGLDAQVLGLG